VATAAGTKPLTSSVFYILLALADADRHGLGIGDEIRARTEGVVYLGPGTLYTTLARMMERGLVQSAAAPDEDDDPRRRYYRITPSGRRELQRESDRLAVVMGAVRDKGLLGDRGDS